MDQPTATKRLAQTALAQEQSKHLQKSLGRFDILLLVVAAVISVEVLGQVSGFGGETFTWTLILAVTFMVPYGLIFAETGGAFTEEGGVYIWTRMAFGRVVAAITSLFTWVTQPVWVGGAMAFVAVETWSEVNYFKILAPACAHNPSWSELSPETPTAPTIRPVYN